MTAQAKDGVTEKLGAEIAELVAKMARTAEENRILRIENASLRESLARARRRAGVDILFDDQSEP